MPVQINVVGIFFYINLRNLQQNICAVEKSILKIISMLYQISTELAEGWGSGEIVQSNLIVLALVFSTQEYLLVLIEIFKICLFFCRFE